MADLRIQTLVFNTPAPEALAGFWSAFLGVEIENRHEGEFVWLAATEPGAPRMAFQRVPDATEGTRRLHADISVPNLAEGIEKAVALGASSVDQHAIGDFVWQVMRDPDGNEFCLSAG